MKKLYYNIILIAIGILCWNTNAVNAQAKEEINYNNIFSTYQLSPKTTAIVVNMADDVEDSVIPPSKFDAIFNKIDDQENIREEYFKTLTNDDTPLTNIHYYDTAGVYKLLHNIEVESKLRQVINKEYYVYGTRGAESRMIKDIVFGLDECITNIFAFTIDKFDLNKNGYPLLASTDKLDLVYGNNYSEVQQKINEFYDSIESDYTDNTPTIVFANMGSLYFTYDDDFKWKNGINYNESQTLFPSRAIFELKSDGTVIPLWEDELDLFGIPCD